MLKRFTQSIKTISRRTFILVGIMVAVFSTAVFGVFGGTILNITLQRNSLDQGLVGHWTFDGSDTTSITASDISGNNNDGTIDGGATPELGLIGQALEFDGTNDHVDIGNVLPDYTTTGGFTISLWVKTDDSGFGRILNFWSGVSSTTYLTWANGEENSNGLASFEWRNANSGNFHAIHTSTSIDDGAWHHLVGVVDVGNNNIKLFVDNSNTNDVTDAEIQDFSFVSDSVDFDLGQETDDSDRYAGLLDDVRVYDRVLTSEEVERLYHLGATTKINTTLTPSALDNNLLLHYTFGNDYLQESITGAFDLSTASYNSTTISTQDSQPHGFAWSSDGSKLYEVGDGGDAIYEYEVSTAWDLSTASYNSTSMSTQDSYPTDIAWSSDGSKLYEVGMNDVIYEYDVSTAWDLSTASYGSTNISAQDSTPRGLAWSSDGSKLYEVGSIGDKIYEYDVSTAWDLSTASYNSTNISVQDTAPYDIAWSSDGSKLYELGAGSHLIYEYDVSTAWDLSTASYNSTSISTQDATPHGIAWNNDGTKLYEVGESGDQFYEYDVGTVNFSSIDRSGNNNDGTITDATAATGKIGQGLEFDGDGDYVQVPDDSSLEGMTELTVSMWVYHNSISGGDHDMLWKGPHGGSEPFGLWRDEAAQDSYAFLLTDENGDYSGVKYSSFVPELEEWTHVAVTFVGGGNVRMYINGQEDSASPFSVSSVDDVDLSADDVYIGTSASLANWFDGQIDDVRMYDSALSQSEIERIYHLGATTTINKTPTRGTSEASDPLGHWTFDGPDVSSTTVTDIAGSEDGTINGDPSASVGAIGQAFAFDGTGDYVNIGPTTVTGNITVSTWARFANTDTATEHLVSGGYDGSNTAWELKQGSTGSTDSDELRFQSYDGTTHGASIPMTTFDTDTWYHIVGIYTGATWKIYVNGVDETNSTYSVGTGAVSNTADRFIGAQEHSGSTAQNFFDGELDDVRIFDGALTEDEIKRLHRMGN